MDLGGLLLDRPSWLVDISLLVIRVFIGTCLVIYGLNKLGLGRAPGVSSSVRWLSELEMPMSTLQARIVMLFELVGGTLLVAGLFARPTCVLLLGMVLAFIGASNQKSGLLITNERSRTGYLINLAVVCGVLALLGPGSISLDAVLF